MIRYRIMNKHDHRLPPYPLTKVDALRLLFWVCTFLDVCDVHAANADIELVVSKVNGKYRAVAAVTFLHRDGRLRGRVIGKSESCDLDSFFDWKRLLKSLSEQVHGGKTQC